ncbi:alpha-ribazole phosphatase [Anoxybacillus calidus]|jgi:alpha-ribazole phosphatase|uniref:Alpha-ribazole phosphatase n=1 Tax=[Anoxybacillus] calidus TaxID=575178 RepID=A0A7V9YXJ4_9BACL|nr:alpha-ribazole phosphatase [Anoxybacillus calidus]
MAMVYDMAITLLRHGLTNENEQKQYIGWLDVPLSTNGVKQLKELAALSYPKADVFVTSDLKRCQQTYEMLFPESVAPSFVMEEWREFHFGNWEGKTYDELKGLPEYRQWLEQPFCLAPPNGESFLQFQTRVEEGLLKVIELFSVFHARHITVVTHGGPIRYILERYAPVERSFWDWHVPFGCGFTLYSTLKRWRERKRCILLSVVPFKENENG